MGRSASWLVLAEQPKQMKIVKIVSLFVVALLGVASLPSANARGLIRVPSRIVFVGRYIAPSRPLSLFTLGTTLAGPSRYCAPVVIYSCRRY